jgi:hypothetical protein
VGFSVLCIPGLPIICFIRVNPLNKAVFKRQPYHKKIAVSLPVNKNFFRKTFSINNAMNYIQPIGYFPIYLHRDNAIGIANLVAVHFLPVSVYNFHHCIIPVLFVNPFTAIEEVEKRQLREKISNSFTKLLATNTH